MPKYDPFASFKWRLAHKRQLTLGPKAIVMGVLNVTPDSFSDGSKNATITDALKASRKMLKAGAEIIDIGGESTRPGADAVSAAQEQDRVLPIIEAINSELGCLISIDTYRAKTADLAIKAGAHIINDVWGFQKDREIADIAVKHEAGCVLMHTGRDRIKQTDVIADQFGFLQTSLKVARSAGVQSEQIVLDPGFGFAKSPEENIELLARISELHTLGQPLLIGTSRKRFLGAITGRSVSRRDIATASTSVLARMQGGAIFRVHDVAKNLDALNVADAVLQVSNKQSS